MATCQRILEAPARSPAPGTRRRRAARRHFLVRVDVLSKLETRRAVGELRDLSASGAQVITVGPLEVGAKLLTRIYNGRMLGSFSGSWPALRRLLAASVATLVPALGCAANPSAAKTARLGEGFTLKVGESALIEAEAFQVKFVDVASDSRCPKDVQCVWEGDATVRIRVQKADAAKRRLELHTASREKDTASAAGYEVRLLRLEPAPVSSKPTRQADYVATLSVSRGRGSTPER